MDRVTDSLYKPSSKYKLGQVVVWSNISIENTCRYIHVKLVFRVVLLVFCVDITREFKLRYLILTLPYINCIENNLLS